MRHSLGTVPTVLLLSILATSCASSSSLYYWGGAANEATKYEQLTYKHYDKHTPESICRLVALYEDMVSHPGGSRKVPPPGICAEYAYLISQPEVVRAFIDNATPAQKKSIGAGDLAAFFKDRAAQLFEMEMSLYPESRTFIGTLVSKLNTQAQ